MVLLISYNQCECYQLIFIPIAIFISESLADFPIHDNRIVKYSYFVKVLHEAALAISSLYIKNSDKSILHFLPGGLHLE